MAKTTAEVLDDVMHEKRISQADIARKLGIKPQSVQQWCSGKSHPRGQNLANLANYLGISPQILMFGSDEKYVPSAVDTEDGYVSIPRFDVSASCGGGARNGECQLIEMMKVSVNWLKRKCPTIDLTHLQVITAVGDSMSPTIENLDFIFVDRRINEVFSDGIYVVNYAGDVFVKRIQKQIDGGILLISDNTRYPAMRVDPSEMDRVKIEGLCKIHCSVSEI